MKKLDRRGLSREAEDTLVQLQDAQRLSRGDPPLCQAEEILQKYPEEKKANFGSFTAQLMQNCGDIREEHFVALERLNTGLFHSIFYDLQQNEGVFGREIAKLQRVKVQVYFGQHFLSKSFFTRLSDFL